MPPFVDVSVLPMYGRLQARIVWKVQPGYEAARYAVVKSPDGLNNWQQIGATRSLEFVDDNLIARGRLDEAYYRVAMDWKGKQFLSDVISTFGRLRRSEFAAVRLIMKREWDTLRRFTPVKFFKLRTDGHQCPKCMDPDTAQKVGTSLCDRCFGTGFDGGYYPAVDTFLQVGAISPKVQEDSREGVGAGDPVTVKTRGTAYPLMEKNDLFVNPSADKRYLIDTIEYGYYNGKVPVYAEMTMQLLARNDIRYTVPI